jgi:CRP/FNR family transcriptional regulator, nitrogen fixation regulation protein
MLMPATSTAIHITPSTQIAARAFHALSGPLDMMGAPMTFGRNGEIYGEGEPADFVYKVVTGAVRVSKALTDGRRQIAAFYFPGDVFGLEHGEEHTFTAEAITPCKVLVMKRCTLMDLVARDGSLARELWALTGREVTRLQDQILLLVKTAQERVVGFLLEMASRRPGGDTVELPMSRRDIADYLGLTIETVSRTLTSLESEAAIDLPNSRRVVLRNRRALRKLNA